MIYLNHALAENAVNITQVEQIEKQHKTKLSCYFSECYLLHGIKLYAICLGLPFWMSRMILLLCII